MTRSLFLRKFNLSMNVRRLGRWLLERSGPARWAPPVPIRDEGPIDPAEFAFLSALAGNHEELHTIDMAVEGMPAPRRCEHYGSACRAFGVARALRLGLDCITNVRRRRHLRRVADSVADAVVALAEVDRALALYFGEKNRPRNGDPRKGQTSGKAIPAPASTTTTTAPAAASTDGASGAALHGHVVRYQLHDHAHACVLPAKLRSPIRELRASLRTFAASGLEPVIAAHREKTAQPGRKRRPPVLALLEEALSDEGFTHREIVELIDDGYGGSVAQRIDRMRKAVAAERLWRSMTDAERRAAGDEAVASESSTSEPKTAPDVEPHAGTARAEPRDPPLSGPGGVSSRSVK